VIGFAPTVVHPIPGVHPPNTPSRAGGYNTWVEVSSDFTLDRISEIFDVKLPWLEGIKTVTTEEVAPSQYKEITVPSSKGGKEYRVVRGVDGKITCSCTGFQYHGKCKHQDMIDNQDAIPAPKKMKKISIPMECDAKPKNTHGGTRVIKVSV
jgi:hypothetical protein